MRFLNNIKKYQSLITTITCAFVLIGFFGSSDTQLQAEEQLVASKQQRAYFSVRTVATDQGPLYTFQVTVPKIDVIKVFPLKSPSRIVVDIKDQRPLKISDLNIANNPMIKNIRIGKHAKFSRYVFDLKTTQVPKFSWRQTEDSFRLLIGGTQTSSQKVDYAFPNQVRAALKPVIPKTSRTNIQTTQNKYDQSPKLAPIDKPVSLPNSNLMKFTGAKEKASITIALLERPGSQTLEINRNKTKQLEVNTKEHANLTPRYKLATPEQTQHTPKPAGQVLSKISFVQDHGGPFVSLALTQKPIYTLKKASSREYKLRINNSNILKEALLLPQFPPKAFEGLTLVIAEQNRRDLDVFFGVEKGTKLSVVRKDSELQVKIR